MKLIYLSTSKLHRNRANLIQTLHTVSALSAKGWSVELFLPPWKGHLSPVERLSELGVTPNFRMIQTQLLHSRWKRVGFLPLCLRLRRRLLASDVVMVRTYYISRALIKHRIPHWFEVHNVDQLAQEGFLKTMITAYNQGIITRLLPISNAAASTLLEAGATPGRISVVPCGADYPSFSSIPLPDQENFANPRIMYIGRISRDRGLEIFLHLARKGVGEIWLIGEVEDGRELLDEEKNVHLVSFVPHREVVQWYRRCDIVLLPYQPYLTTAASFSPLKLFEAMAAGRPIIASDLPPLREVLKNGETAILVPPENVPGWERAVERLKERGDLAVALGARARKAGRAFSWEARAEKLMNIV